MEWCNYFYYDETSPTCLRWKVNRWGGKSYTTLIVAAGSVAGGCRYNLTGKKTLCGVKLDGKCYAIHRIIWELFNTTIPLTIEIDHLDGNPHNNILSNLACKTKQGNARNRKMRIDNSTGITGVSFSTINGKDSYVASWMTADKVYKNSRFSISKYGKDLAFQLACKRRLEKEQEVNSILENNGYTKRHGKQ